MKRMLFVLLLCVAFASEAATRLVTDEAEAVLAILEKRSRNEGIADADFDRVFVSEGYRRLKQREQSMQRAFDDEDFRKFVLSDELLARLPELRTTFDEWSRADLAGAAKLASAYLPEGTEITAKVYPVIKPKTNTFVFDLSGDAAVFIYLEPLPRDVFEGIVAHEFHHVGYAKACPSEIELPANQRELHRWISAFGEGIATVAAAGGPDRPPRLKAEDVAQWEKETKRLPENFATAHSFLTKVLRGELDPAATREQGMQLFGILGPWYSVGAHMVAVIETELGREALLATVCDQKSLLPVYNDAAKKRMARTKESLPLWSEELATAFAPVRRSAAPPPRS